MTFHLAVYDTFADWEYGPAAAHLPGGVVPVGPGPAGEEVTSKAGLTVRPGSASPSCARRTASC